ncbi:MAG: transposase [Solirubrobacterales bacterium]
MDRAAAEAIYDSGREACVDFIIELCERYERQVARLEARVERLEEKLRENSGNSSRPPSADPPAKRPQRERPASQRGPGGQPGHEGTTRKLVSGERVDRFIDHWPALCEGCGQRFEPTKREPAADPHRHQVFELPPVAIEVCEHRAHALLCAGCGKRTRAPLPGALAGSVFGPRLQAAITMLSVRNRISRRDVAELCEELFGTAISVGSIDAICQRTSAGLVGPYGELREQVKDAAVVCVDETGWRQAGEQRTLWGAITERHAAFHIAADRYTRRFAGNLLKLWPALWTFAEIEGVEPTNNRAERGLRGAVIYRKISLGSQSDAGARFAERMLSVSQTCRLQGRSLFTFLIEAIGASARGSPAPSLV